MELTGITEGYKKLQECRFELEVEHFNCLQDLAILETQLHKYQNEFRNYEDSKYATRSEVKKLRQQKRCYEHALECFRNEMGVMSEQLVHLQEILKLSNQSCKEENGQLYQAIVNLQQICDRLQAKLTEAEKKIMMEGQMSQLKDQKIDELQLIIGQKNADLNLHDEAIRDMKVKLENSVLENHELQNSIVSLNSTIMQLQCALASTCRDGGSRSNIPPSCTKSAACLKDEIQSKNRKFDKLQADYQAQYEILKALQYEFEKVKEKDRVKTKSLKRQNETLHERLAQSESNNQHLIEELGNLRDQASHLAENECTREHELAQSKQLILELRQTLIELNESLVESEFHQKSLADVFQKKIQDDRQQDDLFMSCQCEIALYKKLVEDFKASILQAKKNIGDLEARNKSLREELKHNDNKLNDIHKKIAKRDKEVSQHIKELTEKLQHSQEEEKRLADLVENLKGEIHQRMAQNHENLERNKELIEQLEHSQKEEKRLANFIENLKGEIHKRIAQNHENKEKCHCGCINEEADMPSTQEEINSLKVEIKRMIQNQLSLNNENDNLLKQVTTLQSAVTNLEDKNRHLKQKLEKAQSENQKLKEANKILSRDKETYNQTIRNLETDLTEARNYRDDICAESRHVVNNVKAWLEEQKKINEKVKKRTQCYCDAISKLKQENASLLSRPCIPTSTKPKSSRGVNPLIVQPPPPTSVDCPSPWCLGSQGMDSPRDSPSSFMSCSVEEWYSPNYRDETDFETDHEDEFVSRLEAVTLEMKSNNRKWKCKPDCECLVSKDNK